MDDDKFKIALTSSENLYWAWRKVKNYFHSAESWMDTVEIAAFEANLGSELARIAAELSDGTYSMSAMRALPHPKAPDENDEPRIRQFFWVAVRDQVAWTAFVNVIGGIFDSQMPVWSYGGRLFRHVWYEVADDESRRLQIGAYRHSPAQLYRRFRHSWPLYRRHIYLTVRQMTQASVAVPFSPLDEAEQQELDRQQSDDYQMDVRLPYLQPEYWSQVCAPREVYWAGIDFKRFYPSIKLEAVRKNLISFGAFGTAAQSVLHRLTDFPVSLEDMSVDAAHSADLENVRNLTGLPTGLLVSGFLANVAMLDVDLAVHAEARKRCVAHFRYVDDHVILAPSFEALTDWLTFYSGVLETHNVGAVSNPEKTEPEIFRDWLKGGEKGPSDDSVRKACKLDPRYPSPLMTTTLAKVSAIGRVEFDLLDNRERDELLSDLEHLLVTKFPEHELRDATRVAFAASLIARLAPRRTPSLVETVAAHRKLVQRRNAHRKAKSDGAEDALLKQLDAEISSAIQTFDGVEQRRAEEQEKIRWRYFALLMKAVHEYPDKLRLWSRVIEFCRLTGHTEWALFRDEIALFKEKRETSAPYLAAYLLAALADHVLSAARTIGDAEALPTVRRGAIRFLGGVATERFERWLSDPRDSRLLRQSLWTYECALATAVTFARRVGSSSDVRVSSTKAAAVTLEKQLSEATPLDWFSAGKWAASTDISVATWAWWAESRLGGIGSSTAVLDDQSLAEQTRTTHMPSPVWIAAAAQLSPNEGAAWSLLQKHPERFLAVVGRKPLKTTKVLKDIDGGWLYDAARKLPSPEKLLKRLPGSVAVRSVRRALTAQKNGEVNMLEWAELTARWREDPHFFDPRSGEWTALRLVRQVVDLLGAFNDGATLAFNQLHPANILVPREWVNLEPRELSWEKWKEHISSDKQQVRLRRATRQSPLIRDDRLTAEGIGNQTNPMRMRAVGLLLLGLLRRSFEWPPIWNIADQRPAHDGIAIRLAAELPVSSHTAAILDACLTPLAHELMVAGLFEANASGSSVRDSEGEPLLVSDLERLKLHLDRASKELEACQLTVSDQQPRQLVPASLTQRTPDSVADIEMEVQ